MSEYQYYEFRAVDHSLTAEQLDEIRDVSSRAELSPTSFVNEYHYGSFKGNPRQFLERYYDAHIYYANWGSRVFSFRLPSDFIDRAAFKPYLVENVVELAVKKKWAIVEFHSECEDGGDWEEEPDWMNGLLAVRAAMLGGDLRALYLGWLSAVASFELEDDDLEPPVPPGMGQLDASLQMLADYLRIDESLLNAAASVSAKAAFLSPSERQFQAWVKGLPAEDKERLLLEGLAEPSSLWAARCRAQFRASLPPPPRPDMTAPRRKVSELRAIVERAQHEYAERAAEERRQREAREAAERARKLDERAQKRAATLAARKKAKSTR